MVRLYHKGFAVHMAFKEQLPVFLMELMIVF